MYFEKAVPKCNVVKKITDRQTSYCLKPATVLLHLKTPDPIVLCLECARELAKEILDSVAGGRWDACQEGQR